MRTFAFTLTRYTVEDPLTVAIVQNDIGQVPTWVVDGPSTYRAVFAHPIGTVPKQVFTMLGGEFRYIVVEPNGDRELTINTMVTDSTAFEADLTGDFVNLAVFPGPTA